jgi:hypothetical protein
MTKRVKEGMILAAVAVLGIGGLVTLQIVRRGGLAGADDRALVQNQQQIGHNPAAEGQSTLQEIPGNLLRFNEQPEAKRPFLYELSDFSSGAVYSLDPGDGNSRQTFKNGRLTYVYDKPGRYSVKIYASYEGREVLLITTTKDVGKTIVKETVNKKTGKPVIDF